MRTGLLLTLLLSPIAIGPFSSPLSAEQDMSQTESSRAIIHDYAAMRAQGKTFDAHNKYDARLRIEHDPWIADGLGGDEAYITQRQKAEPEKYDSVERYVNVLHNILADGNLVAIKSHVFTNPADPGRVFVDIWRLENGKIAEHWDVIQPIEPSSVNDAPVGCGVGVTYEQAKMLEDTVANPACGEPDRAADGEANRMIVLDYLELSRRPGKIEDAVQTYVADDFVQHAATMPPGKQQLIAYLTAEAERHRSSNWHWEPGRVLADGNFVLVHSRTSSDAQPSGTARVNLFRLQGGKITDHWEVAQPIPEFSVSGRSMVGGPDAPLEPGRRKGSPK